MVVSLYVCDIPKNVTKKDIEEVFAEFAGYVDTRMKVFQDKGKICFIDFVKETDANFVIQTLQGFKFSKEDKGIHIKFSDNSRFGNKSDFKRESASRSRSRSRSRSLSRRRDRESPSRSKQPKNNNLNNPRFSSMSMANPKQGKGTAIGSESLQSNVPNISSSAKGILDILTALNPNIGNLDTGLLSLLANNMGGNSISSSGSDQISSTLLNLLASNGANNDRNTSNADSFRSKLSHIGERFNRLFMFPKNATNIVFVEGIPDDATEREVAHIFRPFPGYRCARIVEREKQGKKSLICFCDFDEVFQAAVCINTLQGYRFDKTDLVGLHLSYGVSKYKK